MLLDGCRTVSAQAVRVMRIANVMELFRPWNWMPFFLIPFHTVTQSRVIKKVSARDVTAACTVHHTDIKEVETSNSISLDQVWDGKNRFAWKTMVMSR